MKENWKDLLIREKMVVISGILLMLSSILLPFISGLFLTISMLLFVLVVSYNMYKVISKSDAEDNEKDNYKELEDYIETFKEKGTIILPISFFFGVIGMLIYVIYPWLAL